MKAVWLIARRELAAYLRTLSGYVIIAGVLLVAGLLFNTLALGGGAKLSGEVLEEFFYDTSGLTMIAAILLSMRLIAEERQTGTVALLYSSPVRDVEIVLGKFLSGFLFLALFVALTVYMPALVLVNGKISWGHIAAGYLGLLLLGAASLAIGTFGSSLTRSQVLSALISGVILVAMLLCWLIARVAERPLSEVFSALALHGNHFKAFQTGVVHLRDIVFYVMVTYAFLFAATRVMEARRWK